MKIVNRLAAGAIAGIFIVGGVGSAANAATTTVVPVKKTVVVDAKKQVVTDEWLRKQEPKEWLR